VIPRPRHLLTLQAKFAHFPVVAMLGARQVGKTTLSRQLAKEWQGPSHHFDLEDPDDQARLGDPSFVLRELRGLVVIDEVQLRPDLFPLLRVLADRPECPAKFLLLGSAAPELLKATAETMAGRVVFHHLDGLEWSEVAPTVDPAAPGWMDERWLKGGFPRAFLAKSMGVSREWRDAFIRTYLERDLPQLGINLPALTLRRFWTMLAHYHGQTWNGSELARSLGVSDKTVSRYLDILEGTFMAFRLLPWHANVGKREIKSPKVYVSDTGLLHSLLGIARHEDLLAHPKCGASWEGAIIRELLLRFEVQRGEAFFWGTHSGADLDLLVVKGAIRLGFEVKLTRSPKVTASMKTAMEALGLEHVYVMCHGQGAPRELTRGITAVPVGNLSNGAWLPELSFPKWGM
jgi:predicted AAA+ superfamily ATPase